MEKNRHYSLVCLDIMAPGVDGHSALSTMRELATKHGVFGNDGTNVAMGSSLRESKHCVRSFVEGCEAYVTKPINAEELFEKDEF